MNKADVVFAVAQKSGVSVRDCEKVIDAFEEILNERLSQSIFAGKAFDHTYAIMKYFKGKKSKDE